MKFFPANALKDCANSQGGRDGWSMGSNKAPVGTEMWYDEGIPISEPQKSALATERSMSFFSQPSALSLLSSQQPLPSPWLRRSLLPMPGLTSARSHGVRDRGRRHVCGSNERTAYLPRS